MGKYEADRRPNIRQNTTVSTQRANTAVDDATRKAPTPQQIASRQKAQRNQRIAIISACAGALLLLIIMIVCLLLNPSETDSNTIANNVYAAGVDLSGMTKDEARNALKMAIGQSVQKKNMIVILPDGKLELSPADTHPTVDVDAVVDAAFSYGRNGSTQQSGVYTVALLPYMKQLDTDYIRSAIDEFCAERGEVVQSTVSISGQRPEFDPENPDKPVVHQMLTITIGSPDYNLDAQTIYDDVLDKFSLNQTEVQYLSTEDHLPETILAEDVFAQFCTQPVNAEQDPKTYEITPEIYGYGFDIDEVQKLIDDASFGQTLEIELEFLEPDVTAAKLRDGMFVVLLGEYTTICSEEDSSPSRNANLKTSCEALNGLIIGPGDTFSFNKILGRPTSQLGYKECPGYLKGELVDIVGGGIDQTASTLYYCALMADLDILERTNNCYPVSYIASGLDVLIDWGNDDLKFVNTTDAPIRINATASGRSVSVQLWGSEALDYDIEIITEELERYEPETIYQPMDKNNIHGVFNGDVLQEGIAGCLVQTSVKKIHKQTQLEISTTLVDTSKYDTRDEIIAQVDHLPNLDFLNPPTDSEDSTEATEG
ncbi:MAG: hypothetical protein E7466_02945 [Ruminococcaceae bacterium]|nr:hypothetical protein [Oscillospiraceae bacterium]